MPKTNKHQMGNDHNGEPLYADAWLVEIDKAGKENRYPAKIEKEEDSIVRVWVGQNRQQRKTVKVADLRVDFGTTVLRMAPNHVMKVQPEYKPVFGVARRGSGYNATNRNYYEPMSATAEEIAAMNDAEKTQEQLIAELQATRARVQHVPNIDGYAAMSDKDLRAHAKSLEIKISKDVSRSDVIKAIEAIDAE